MTSGPVTWPWQRLNESNANAHEVLAGLLEPEPGERWLDVGTGGGGLAFALAQRGATVVGVDVAEDGLAHAREAAAARAAVAAEFVVGDAEALPFEDASFAGVASAFGVIFAADRERAAAELARVCRAGGKLGLALMPMDSRAGAMFSLFERHGRAAHPARWAEEVERLLGDAFELEVERRESPSPASHSHSWEDTVRGFAPLRELVERLSDDEVAALRAELEAIEERYRERPASYFVVLGRRR